VSDQPNRAELDLQASYRLVEELSRSELRYRNLVEQLHEVVFQADRQLCFTFLNPAWSALTAIPVAEAVGRPISDFIVESDRPLSALQRDQIHPARQPDQDRLR